MNNHYAKFEYKGMKTVGVTDYTSQTTPKHFGWKKCLSSTPIKMRKYLSNVHKMGGAHLQYVLFVCLIWFFTSTQQSFSYAGRFFMGLTSTKLG